MKIVSRLFTLIVLVLVAGRASAASNLDEYFYASGKIKVVIAVAAIVLSGLITYLIILDRKIKKLEERGEK